MGTRSLTHFMNKDGKTLCTVYRQFDGYPSVQGMELATVLKGKRLVNGFSGDDQKVGNFNGMGCLTAQVIAALKTEIGNIYIYPPGSSDCGEEYIYTISGEVESGKINIKCFDVYGEKIIIDCDPADFEAKAEAIEG